MYFIDHSYFISRYSQNAITCCRAVTKGSGARGFPRLLCSWPSAIFLGNRDKNDKTRSKYLPGCSVPHLLTAYTGNMKSLRQPWSRHWPANEVNSCSLWSRAFLSDQLCITCLKLQSDGWCFVYSLNMYRWKRKGKVLMTTIQLFTGNINGLKMIMLR